MPQLEIFFEYVFFCCENFEAHFLFCQQTFHFKKINILFPTQNSLKKKLRVFKTEKLKQKKHAIFRIDFFIFLHSFVPFVVFIFERSVDFQKPILAPARFFPRKLFHLFYVFICGHSFKFRDDQNVWRENPQILFVRVLRVFAGFELVLRVLGNFAGLVGVGGEGGSCRRRWRFLLH